MFIKDPGSEFFPSRIPDPGSEFIPFRIHIKELKHCNPKKWFLSFRKYDPGCSSQIRIRILTFYPSRIPDPGVKRHRISDPDRQHWSWHNLMWKFFDRTFYWLLDCTSLKHKRLQKLKVCQGDKVCCTYKKKAETLITTSKRMAKGRPVISTRKTQKYTTTKFMPYNSLPDTFPPCWTLWAAVPWRAQKTLQKSNGPKRMHSD